jgi:hypothetical protein
MRSFGAGRDSGKPFLRAGFAESCERNWCSAGRLRWMSAHGWAASCQGSEPECAASKGLATPQCPLAASYVGITSTAQQATKGLPCFCFKESHTSQF